MKISGNKFFSLVLASLWLIQTGLPQHAAADDMAKPVGVSSESSLLIKTKQLIDQINASMRVEVMQFDHENRLVEKHHVGYRGYIFDAITADKISVDETSFKEAPAKWACRVLLKGDINNPFYGETFRPFTENMNHGQLRNEIELSLNRLIEVVPEWRRSPESKATEYGVKMQLVQVQTSPIQFFAEVIESDKDYRNYTIICQVNIVLKPVIFLTEQGEKWLRELDDTASINPGAGIVPNAIVLERALKNLLLLPSQRKLLAGFINNAKQFVAVLKQEQAKGREGKPITHQYFLRKAVLLVAYYRSVIDNLNECAQLSAEEGGGKQLQKDHRNQQLVPIIQQAMTAIIDAYGLGSDVKSRRSADFSWVLTNLLSEQLSPLSRSNEVKDFIRPIMLKLGEVISLAEGDDDLAAQPKIREFAEFWDKEDFQLFLVNILSTTDDKLNLMILNICAYAVKLANVGKLEIRVFNSQADIDRVIRQRSSK